MQAKYFSFFSLNVDEKPHKFYKMSHSLSHHESALVIHCEDFVHNIFNLRHNIPHMISLFLTIYFINFN